MVESLPREAPTKRVWRGLSGGFPRTTTALVLLLFTPLVPRWGTPAVIVGFGFAGLVFWRSLVISIAIEADQHGVHTITVRNWTRSRKILASGTTFTTTRLPLVKFLVVGTETGRTTAHGVMFFGSPDNTFFDHQRRLVQELRMEMEAIGVTFIGRWPPAAGVERT